MRRTPPLAWTLWTAAVAMAALLLLFPLHVALQLAGVEARGVAARNVSGTIWSGSMEQVRMGGQQFGSFDLALRPLPLALLATEWRFSRQPGAEGPFSGRMRADGAALKLAGLEGRIPVAGLFAPLPVEAMEFSDATIAFAGNRCVEAAGSVRAVASATLPGLDTAEPLEGPLRCADGRLQLSLAPPSRRYMIDLEIGGEGRWTGRLRILRVPPDLALQLPLAGFRAEGTGFVLTRDGSLR